MVALPGLQPQVLPGLQHHVMPQQVLSLPPQPQPQPDVMGAAAMQMPVQLVELASPHPLAQPNMVYQPMHPMAMRPQPVPTVLAEQPQMVQLFAVPQNLPTPDPHPVIVQPACHSAAHGNADGGGGGGGRGGGGGGGVGAGGASGSTEGSAHRTSVAPSSFVEELFEDSVYTHSGHGSASPWESLRTGSSLTDRRGSSATGGEGSGSAWPDIGLAEAMQQLPCRHNMWENVRVRRGQMCIRCRLCQKRWKCASIIAWKLMRCRSFLSRKGCTKGSECAQLHFYKRRKAAQGEEEAEEEDFDDADADADGVGSYSDAPELSAADRYSPAFVGGQVGGPRLGQLGL